MPCEVDLVGSYAPLSFAQSGRGCLNCPYLSNIPPRLNQTGEADPVATALAVSCKECVAAVHGRARNRSQRREARTMSVMAMEVGCGQPEPETLERECHWLLPLSKVKY